MNNIYWEICIEISRLICIFIGCRFLTKTLIPKYPLPVIYIATILFEAIYGGLNTAFRFTDTTFGSFLYSYVGIFFLCTLLFRGTLLKKIFLVVLRTSSYTGLASALLPFAQLFQADNPAAAQTAQLVMIYITVILWGLLLEFIVWRFRNLKQEMPNGLTAYLLFVNIFTLISTMTILDISRYSAMALPMLYPESFLAVLSLCGTLVVVFAIFTLDKELSRRLSAQSILMQLTNLREKEEYWRRLASFRHDIKNNMSCLGSLLRMGNNEAALAYLETLTDTIKQLDSGISTGNEFADAILNEKITLMKEKNIAFTEEISLPSACRLEPVELCCILSNTLDNAIEACERIPNGDRWIKAQAFVKQSQLIVVIENSIAVETVGNIPPLRTQEGRGIGLFNVRGVIEKYGGAMDISVDKSFVFSAMLQVID